ncbi:MAG: ABC transporter ATP-binding protein [Pseudomonadota bacterium]
MESVIECRGLSHAYGRKKVLNDLNFSAPPGRILGLLGKNGAGKTTTINILMGFLEPLAGDCRIFGEPSHNIRPLTRRRIGLLHEGHLQYDFMTIHQIERFHSRFYPNWNRSIFFELIDKLNLKLNHKIRKMSCGQRSQVALGLILAQEPELFMLDDYSMGLDAGYRRLFLELFCQKVRQTGRTVLLTSHIVQDLEKLVDDIIILHQGRVLVQSPLTDFMKNIKSYSFSINSENGAVPMPRDEVILNHEQVGPDNTVFSYENLDSVKNRLDALGFKVANLRSEPLGGLEDVFIGLTGRY